MYRKINVDGVIYEYSAGKGGLKVKGLPYINKETLTGDWWNLNTPVNPAKVAEFIRKNKK